MSKTLVSKETLEPRDAVVSEAYIPTSQESEATIAKQEKTRMLYLGDYFHPTRHSLHRLIWLMLLLQI